LEITILHIEPLVLSGQKIQTCVASQETSKLWRPFRQAIREKAGLFPNKFYSIGRYGKEMTQSSFTIYSPFEKIAAISAPLDSCPEGFEKILLEGGLYAVFKHQGSMTKFQSSLEVFLVNWLPMSKYSLDDRAHFETFDDTYDPLSDDSEEWVHIPIIEKVSTE
jgi:AraC family transcriptional regulator